MSKSPFVSGRKLEQEFGIAPLMRRRLEREKILPSPVLQSVTKAGQVRKIYSRAEVERALGLHAT